MNVFAALAGRASTAPITASGRNTFDSLNWPAAFAKNPLACQRAAFCFPAVVIWFLNSGFPLALSHLGAAGLWISSTPTAMLHRRRAEGNSVVWPDRIALPLLPDAARS